jgi:hypothetical protein
MMRELDGSIKQQLRAKHYRRLAERGIDPHSFQALWIAIRMTGYALRSLIVLKLTKPWR